MRPINNFLMYLGARKLIRSVLTWRFKRELAEFLRSGERIRFDSGAAPMVSVIIPVFNSAHHTFRCLKSLAADASVPLEVIVFDNASTDATNALLQRFENITVIRNAENLGFLKAVNLACTHAHGQFILLLNNDATILSGHLADATRVFENEPSVGAVGARVKFVTGHLQEAGSIIFRDGSTDGYLHKSRSDHFSGMYMRDVDFCSGVFLLLETRKFAKMGYLDEAFAPAYYEETDLCMRLRAEGLRVIYNPSIVVEHFEFGSQPSRAAFAAMAARRPIFLQKWQATLDSESYASPEVSNEVASRRLVPHPRLLLILDQNLPENIPAPIQSAIRHSLARGWHSSLFIVGLKSVSWEKAHTVLGNRIELILNRGKKELAQLVQERRGEFDLIAAIGVDAEHAINHAKNVAPGSLSGTEIVSGKDPEVLTQALNRRT
jgi:GT2 family glycosyltransferase